VEREFARIGVLLRHDPILPSFTTLAVGGPIRGSWWSHPRTHEIYDLLQRFDRAAGLLSVKLVNEKVTYVHRRLWPALLSLSQGRGAWQREGLAPPTRALLRSVQRRGAIRADRISLNPPSRRALTIRELEVRLLVHTTSVHTETGAHRKLLRSWARWCADSDYSFERISPAEARHQLEVAVRSLAVPGAPQLRLPWTERFVAARG
jgi:hypothetical protein